MCNNDNDVRLVKYFKVWALVMVSIHTFLQIHDDEY